jgi:autoinducer 2-degrading protein
MLTVLVHAHVKPECAEAFRAACRENASHSVREPGIARFDFLQEEADPTRFLLIEAYREPAAAAAHKETGHYRRWKEEVAGMMAEPRSSVRYDWIQP